MHQLDFESHGFEWIDCNDADQSIISYLRRDHDGRFIVAVLNLTPVVREHYRLGVPEPGFYRELLNTDAEAYGGSNIGNLGGLVAEPKAWMDRAYSIELTLPPLACVIFQPE